MDPKNQAQFAYGWHFGELQPGFTPLLTYTVTPRYFDDKQSLQPIEPGLDFEITIDV
jgi:hypothetical protein